MKTSSLFRGGAHGLLGINAIPEIYQTITGHKFNQPESPERIPITTPGSTEAQNDEIGCQYKEALCQLNMVNHAEDAPRQ